MNRTKQYLGINQSSNEETITSIEDLSNEIFFEIFYYLDGCDLFEAFSNLNYHFQNLLNDLFLLLKVNLSFQLKCWLKYQCTHIIIPKKHRILSLHIMNCNLNALIFEYFTTDASFNRLESLVLNKIPSDELESILIGLYSLPRLSSLTIYHKNIHRNSSDIHSMIFGLPLLKYCKLSIISYSDYLLSISFNLQNNSIQHLVCCESLTLEDLNALLSYTPRLNRLVCKRLFDHALYIDIQILLTLPNLAHLTIDQCYVSFGAFEIFIRSISSQLEVLRINSVTDLTYFNAKRWEPLISEYIPHLRMFHFQYREFIDDDFKLMLFNKLMDRFNS